MDLNVATSLNQDGSSDPISTASDVKLTTQDAHDARSTSSSSPKSALLALPPELRNMIYKYALTSREDLVICELDPGKTWRCMTFTSATGPRVTFNSLAFVNNMLHAETKDLEYQLGNRILLPYAERDCCRLSQILPSRCRCQEVLGLHILPACDRSTGFYQFARAQPLHMATKIY